MTRKLDKNTGHDLYCAIGNKALALGLPVTEIQVAELANTVLEHVYGRGALGLAPVPEEEAHDRDGYGSGSDGW